MLYNQERLRRIEQSLRSANPIFMFFTPKVGADENGTFLGCSCCGTTLDVNLIMLSPQFLMCRICYDFFILMKKPKQTGFVFTESGDIISSVEYLRAA